jgi:hypothetical protein
MNLGRRCTPPKVDSIPYFPMVKEENARQGFLTDQQYAKLRDELPDYLKPLFITAYVTGVRLGELLAWIWDGVDFAQSFVTLHADETKSGYSRAVPIVEGDMRKWLLWSREHAEDCARVFHREGGANQAVQDCLIANQPVFPNSNSTTCAGRRFGICAAPVLHKSCVCVLPGTGPIQWSAATTSWISKISKQPGSSWNGQ